METSLKTLQIVRLALLVSIVFYVLIAKLLPSSAIPNPTIFYAVTLMAAWCVVVIFVMGRKFVLRSELVLAAQPADAKALARWRAGYLITYSCSEAVALWGLVLHFLGFALPQIAPFYVAGFILLLFFSPRRLSNEVG